MQIAISECLAYSRLQADSNAKFAAWPTSWRPLTNFHVDDRSELSHVALQ